MVRRAFDMELLDLRKQIVAMGDLVEQSIEQSVDALARQDMKLAQQVIARDDIIDDLSYRAEEQSLVVIATQQPLARDLRLISSVMFIASEIERMGDYCEGIAKITVMQDKLPHVLALDDIFSMAEKSRSMLHRAVQAFYTGDVALARQIWDEDDAVDDLYNKVYKDLIDVMIANRATTQSATHLLWASHNLERIADRTTNICERTAFMVTGNRDDLRGHGY